MVDKVQGAICKTAPRKLWGEVHSKREEFSRHPKTCILYQPAETLTHARMLRVGARLPYPLGPPDVFAMAVSVVARAA
jgi:hypothetical protein